jgi:hypothetical protein
MFRPALSPDETRVAGVMRDGGDAMLIIRKLGMVDLATLEETIIPTREMPSMAAWVEDGSLFYAAVTETRLLLDGLSQEDVDRVNLATGSNLENVPFNTIRLYRIAPDGTETLLHEQDAYAVGRLFVNGETLVYSTVPNGDAWVEAILNGTLTTEDAWSHAEDYLPVSVQYLTLDETGAVVGGGTFPGDLRRVAG